MNIRVLLVALLVLLVKETDGKKNDCGKPPHSDECLLKMWMMSGCDPKGTHAPPKGPVDIWRMMEIKDLSVEMKKYKKRSMSGWVEKDTGTEYVTLCYGKKGGKCGRDSTPGPHTRRCLQQMWEEAKCFVTGTGYPVPGSKMKYWNRMTVGTARGKMRTIKRDALNRKKDKTGEPYVQLCYGCGISNTDDYIFRGSNVTDPQRWPWVVSIHSSTRFRSNGAIISPKWILTDLGGVKGYQASDLTVRMGVVDISDNGPPPVIANVRRIILHEDHEYTSRPFKLIHDIALLELTEEVELGPTVKPICLPRLGGKAYNHCYVTGWGEVGDSSGSQSKILQELQVKLLDDSECLERSGLSWVETGGVQCADGKRNGQICQKDNGAPLVCKQGKNDYYVAVGVGSWWAYGCDKSDLPMGFGQVDEKVTWIRKKCKQCN